MQFDMQADIIMLRSFTSVCV